MSGCVSSLDARNTPRDPCCASIRFDKSRARRRVVPLHCSRPRWCALLRCNFSVRLESYGCSGAHFPAGGGAPSRVASQSVLCWSSDKSLPRKAARTRRTPYQVRLFLVSAKGLSWYGSAVTRHRFSPRGLDLASSVIKLALRGDARRGPASCGEVSARAADGLRSHSKIAAQESASARAGAVQGHGPPPSTRFGKAR
jgi:hypothetical protein